MGQQAYARVRRPVRTRPEDDVRPGEPVPGPGDRDGRAQLQGALDRRTIGIAHDQLKAVPLRVGLAAGAKKLHATLALVRGRVLDVLIVDTPLARGLLAATSEK